MKIKKTPDKKNGPVFQMSCLKKLYETCVYKSSMHPISKYGFMCKIEAIKECIEIMRNCNKKHSQKAKKHC